MNIALVSSRGGHLGQINLLFTKEVIGEHNAVLITESELGVHVRERNFLNKFRTYFFNKDYLGINPLRYFLAIIQMIRIFRKEKVNIIFTNGAQISIPAVIASKLLGIKTVFIDTVIRVKTPNWSAKACYFLSDIFIVQHESMKKKYGKRAEYSGGIV